MKNIDIAKDLTKLNYRKLPKDSVLLSKEDYEEYIELRNSEIGELVKENKQLGTQCLEWMKLYHNQLNKTKEARKETAEKILNELVGHTFEDDGWTWTVSKEDIQWLADKHKVKIKE